MAKIPQDLGQLSSPRPAGSVATYQVPRGGEAVGEILQRGAAQLQRGADVLFQKAKQEQDRLDTLRAEDAFTKLRAQQNDLTLGAENGFRNKQGSDAIGPEFLQGYTERFDAASRQLEDGLANDRQREKFRERAQIAGGQYQHELLVHIANESKTYRKQVAEGTISTEIQGAAARWNDPAAVGISLERIKGAVNERAAAENWAPEYKQAVLLEQQGKAHAAVIGQAIASGQLRYAEEWFKSHRSEIDVVAAKQLEHAVADGAQKELANNYNAAYLASRDSSASLEAIEKRLSADENLDETRKNAILGRVLSRMDVLNRRAEAEQRRVEATLGKAITQINANTRAGFEPGAEQLTQLVNAAKGTNLEADAGQMVALADATRTFRLSLPQRQEAAITHAETEIRKDPTKFDLQLLNSWKEIYSRQQAGIKEDPTTFAVRQGLIDEKSPAAMALDLSKPQQLGDGLAARFALARGMVDRYQAPMKPLTKEETDLLSSFLRGANDQQKSQYFSQLAQASRGDMDGFRAVMAQISPDDPVTAIGGAYAGSGYRQKDGDIVVGDGKQVSELIFRGQTLLRPNRKEDGTPAGGKTWPMPAGAEEQKMRQLFAGLERDAFAGLGPVRSAYEQTAKAVYAALSEQSGDSSGVLDANRWETSIKLATGGFDRVNGKSVILPYGYTTASFRDGLAARIGVLADRLPEGVSVGKVKDLPLETAGDGRYVFRSGDRILLDKDGAPLIIDFNRGLPFRTSGYGLEPPAPQGPSVRSVLNAEKKRNPKPADLVPSGMSGVRG